MDTLQTLHFVPAEDKSYLEAENEELEKIVKSLRDSRIIDADEAEKLSEQIVAGDVLDIPPVGKNDPDKLFRTLRRIVGNTREAALQIGDMNQLIIKYESENPFGSHYDRVYLMVLEDFMKGDKADKDIIEISSGNAAVSCTVMSRLLGKEVQMVIPTTRYRIRQTLTQRLGATVIPSERSQGLDGANATLVELLHRNSRDGKPAWFLNHSHRDDVLEPMGDIAREVLQRSSVDYFLSAMGNGTSLRGIGESLGHARIIGVRYDHPEKTSEMLMPGGDEVTIPFPHLEHFSPHEIVRIPYQDIQQHFRDAGLGLTSYMVQRAYEKYLRDNCGIVHSTFLILNYDHINRYAE